MIAIDLIRALFDAHKWLWVAPFVGWLWFGSWLLHIAPIGWWTLPLLFTTFGLGVWLLILAIKKIVPGV